MRIFYFPFVGRRIKTVLWSGNSGHHRFGLDSRMVPLRCGWWYTTIQQGLSLVIGTSSQNSFPNNPTNSNEFSLSHVGWASKSCCQKNSKSDVINILVILIRDMVNCVNVLVVTRCEEWDGGVFLTYLSRRTWRWEME